ncbi:Vesicle-associated membrane protein 714, partial [Cucurbita argyrosperma subsp. sororia]
MAILYAVVARGTVILAEFSAVAGNTGAVARRILEKLPDEADSRLCFSQERYIFHILRSDGLTFLCMANDTFGRRIPFSYLEDVHMRFMKNYGRVAHYAPAYAMNDEFSRVLHQQMEFFSSNPSADTLNRVRGEVNEIRTVMVDNIEKILERGDRIELLVDKTATMQDGAFHFKKQSKRLHRALWMKNAKLLALMTCLIIVLLGGISWREGVWTFHLKKLRMWTGGIASKTHLVVVSTTTVTLENFPQPQVLSFMGKRMKARKIDQGYVAATDINKKRYIRACHRAFFIVELLTCFMRPTSQIQTFAPNSESCNIRIREGDRFRSELFGFCLLYCRLLFKGLEKV